MTKEKEAELKILEQVMRDNLHEDYARSTFMVSKDAIIKLAKLRYTYMVNAKKAIEQNGGEMTEEDQKYHSEYLKQLRLLLKNMDKLLFD